MQSLISEVMYAASESASAETTWKKKTQHESCENISGWWVDTFSKDADKIFLLSHADGISAPRRNGGSARASVTASWRDKVIIGFIDLRREKITALGLCGREWKTTWGLQAQLSFTNLQKSPLRRRRGKKTVIWGGDAEVFWHKHKMHYGEWVELPSWQ